MLTASQLHGFSREDAECFGKPHFNATYTDHGGTSLTRYVKTSMNCCICGRDAISTHHQPRREYFTLSTPLGTWKLRPALFALCGTGTWGCHGDVEHNRIRIRWKWDRQEGEDKWWSGELLDAYGPHSIKLYDWGCWEIELPDGTKLERRKRWRRDD